MAIVIKAMGREILDKVKRLLVVGGLHRSSSDGEEILRSIVAEKIRLIRLIRFKKIKVLIREKRKKEQEK